jgi:peptidase M48-like protein
LGGVVQIVEESPGSRPELQPLAYHCDVVALLQDKERTVWDWAAAQRTLDDQIASVRASMLRETYRLDPAAHQAIHDTCHKAMAALEIDAPATLYQAADGAMNAALCYIPGEVHLIFYGAILERLSGDEMVALMGHELAHYRLWSLESGAFHVANRILDHALVYPDAAPSHFETARLYALSTELFADRGAAVAAGSAHPAISTLVKTMTGLTNVDAASYLKQAAELDAAGSTSQGNSHPEAFLRAQAVDRWWNGDAELNSWIDARLRGPLSLATLDLPRQHELTAITRKFFVGLLSDKELRSEAAVTQIKRFLPDWDANGPRLEDGELSADRADASIRDYLVALTCDIAMADRDIRDEVLVAGARMMRRFDAMVNFRDGLKRNLKMTKQAIDKIVARTEVT